MVAFKDHIFLPNEFVLELLFFFVQRILLLRQLKELAPWYRLKTIPLFYCRRRYWCGRSPSLGSVWLATGSTWRAAISAGFHEHNIGVGGVRSDANPSLLINSGRYRLEYRKLGATGGGDDKVVLLAPVESLLADRRRGWRGGVGYRLRIRWQF